MPNRKYNAIATVECTVAFIVRGVGDKAALPKLSRTQNYIEAPRGRALPINVEGFAENQFLTPTLPIRVDPVVIGWSPIEFSL